MITKFKADRDPQGFNVAILDCSQETQEKILEQVMAMPFLAEKRLIILENLLSATKKGQLQEEILERVKDKKLPEENIYLFWEGDLKPKTNTAKELFKILSKEKYAQEFITLAGTKLSAWAEAEVKNRKGKISREALNYLTNNIGGDMWQLNNIIDQLIAFKATPETKKSVEQDEIKISDVQLFLNEKIDDNIFNLVDAITAGQTKKAYSMIREQYKKGEDSLYILAMLIRQFRILIELRDLFDREDNLASDALAKKLELHPFVVKKSLPFIKRYTLNELKNIYQKLLEIDIKTKTGVAKPDLLLDLFVGSI